MIRIFDIAGKDLLQMLRDRKIFLFLLVMPIAFTLLFGYAFGGFSRGTSDSRLPVGYLDADDSWLSQNLQDTLNASEVIRLEVFDLTDQGEIEKLVADEKLAAAIIVPPNYADIILEGSPAKLILIADTSTPAGTTVKSAVITAANRLDSAVRTALIMEQAAGEAVPFDYAFGQALSAWQDPPIQVTETTSSAINEQDDGNMSLAHTSPGMMLQFAIASLLICSQVIVSERKSRSLQRLLTTATNRVHILLGHYLAIFGIIFGQFLVLIAFGQYLLKVNYLNDPLATLLVAAFTAMCIAALGLLIGVLAKSEEQAIVFSLVPMFVFAGLGGAWVPLEVTGATFQAIGHLTPIAWGMDGFKNISIRGLGMEGVLLPVIMLAGYAVLFLAIAAWRFQRSQES
jgi:ABC-2 type transport system permease protein